MNPERHRQIKELFLEVCDLEVSERDAVLERRCAGDSALRAAVEAQLRADAGSARLESGSGARARLERLIDGAPEDVPDQIGKYRILSRLGEGGMGTVFEAEQDSPRRRVALKVIRGLGSEQAMRRFERESEVLGRLQHPGIAQIYEAGTATLEHGARVPYFAMELIDGVALRDAAREMSVEHRVELLARLSEAVHHAHQKGIIHRDLKPENVLVIPGEGCGSPKILDFGVARAVDPGATMQTDPGQLVGTLPYMSPEQVSGRPDDLDVRSDVYALGVLLFEVLSGRLPYEIGERPLVEATRVIREEAPTRLGTVSTRLRGDIETITSTALEKDPTRRYSSASALASDLRRYLRHEPIAARPASAAYQLRRFARRHRAVVAGLGVIACVLIAATGVSSWLAIREASARRESQLSEQAARADAARFEAVSAFLEKMLTSADPHTEGGGLSTTVGDVLEQAAMDVEAGALSDQPGVEVSVRTTIGNAYRAIGENEVAERHLREAVLLGERASPGGDAPTAQAMNKLGRLLQDTGRFEEAAELFEGVVAIRGRLYTGDHRDIAIAHNNLGMLRLQTGELDEAEELLRAALEMRRRLYGDRDGSVASSLNNLGLVWFNLEDYGQAAATFRESLEIDQAIKGEHPHVATTMCNLGVALMLSGDLDEAEEHARASLLMRQRLFGDDHVYVGNSMRALGSVQRRRGDPGAVEHLRRGLALESAVGGAMHPATASGKLELGLALEAGGGGDEALELIRACLEIRAERLPGTSKLAQAEAEYSLALQRRGRTEEAVAAADRAILTAREAGASGARLAHCLLVRARCCLPDEAGVFLSEARAVSTARTPAERALREEIEAALKNASADPNDL